MRRSDSPKAGIQGECVRLSLKRTETGQFVAALDVKDQEFVVTLPMEKCLVDVERLPQIAAGATNGNVRMPRRYRSNELRNLRSA